MFFCNYCKSLFEEPEVTYDSERLEHFGYPCRQSMNCCPKCENEDFEEVEQCYWCGEFIGSLSMCRGYCPKCVKEIVQKFDDFVETISEDERKFLNYWFGVEIFTLGDEEIE
jgi:hypothetical protein